MRQPAARLLHPGAAPHGWSALLPVEVRLEVCEGLADLPPFNADNNPVPAAVVALRDAIADAVLNP